MSDDKDPQRISDAADNCEVLRARLAKYEDAEGRPISTIAEQAREIERLRLNIAEYNEHERCYQSEIERLKEGQDILILARDEQKRLANEYRDLWSRAAVKAQPARVVLADDIRAACQNAGEVFAEETNAAQCREVAEYMREVLLARLNSSPVSSGVYSDDPLACSGCVSGCFRCRALAGVDDRAAFEVEIPSIAATFDGLYLTPVMPLKAGDHLMTIAQHLLIEKQIRAALTASAPNHSEQVRDGWQLVPKVATPEMKSAIWAELDRQGFDSDLVETQSLYYAGIAAAPSAGSQGGDV